MLYSKTQTRVWSAVIVLAAGSMFGSAAIAAGVCACDGDVAPPFDGFVGPADITIAVECADGTANPADCTLADVDCDGQVTACDVGNVIKQFLGQTNTCDTACGACCLDAGGCGFEQAELCSGDLANGAFTDYIGTFFGDDLPCAHVDCARGIVVPATSEWGLVTLAMVILTCGTLIVRRRAALGTG